MDRPTVCIETSIVSYLAAHPAGDPVTAANQRLTHAWWNERRHEYALFTSPTVLDEAAAGDPRMAQVRLALLAGVDRLHHHQEVALLAGEIFRIASLPPRARTDAAHIAYAAVYGTGYLLTWNCRHIANPALEPKVRRACRLRGYNLPVLCTPKLLLEK